MYIRKKINLTLLISLLYFAFFFVFTSENLISLNIITENTYSDNLFNNLYLLDSFFHLIFFIGIYLIIVLYSNDKFYIFKRFNVWMVTILYLITVLVPFMTYNIQVIYVNSFVKVIVLLFAIYEINVKDKDNIRIYYPIVEIINTLYMVLYSIIGIIVYPITYITLGFKKTEVKDTINKNHLENIGYKIFLGIFAGLVGFVLCIVTFILLGITDSSFFNNFDSLHVVKLILELFTSLIVGFILTAFINVYKESENKYNKFILNIKKINHKYANYNWVTNIVMGFLIPGYLLFIIYEYVQILDPEKMTGNIAYYGYFSISFVVLINIALIIIFYYFYNQGQIKSLLLRVFILILNLLLLGIAFSQIYLLTSKYYSLTHPRYYALIAILFLFLISLILLIKTINLKININKPLIIIMIFTYSLFFLIDIDTIIYSFNTSYQEQSNEYYDEAYLYTLDPRWVENLEVKENSNWYDDSNTTIEEKYEKYYCRPGKDENQKDWMCRSDNKSNYKDIDMVFNFV